MNFTQKKKGIITSVLLIVALVLAVFRGFLMSSEKYIDMLGLYVDKNMGTLFDVLVFLLVGAAVVIYLFVKKACFDVKPVKTSRFSAFSSFLCMIMMIVVLFTGIFQLTCEFSIFLAIETVLCVPSAAYLLKVFVENVKKEEDNGGFMAIFPALYVAIRATGIFMDTKTQINASQRSFTLLFLAITMLFFMAEAEFFIPLGTKEREKSACSKRGAKLYAFSVLVSQLALIISVTGLIFNNGFTTRETSLALLDVSFGIYALSKNTALKIQNSTQEGF